MSGKKRRGPERLFRDRPRPGECEEARIFRAEMAGPTPDDMREWGLDPDHFDREAVAGLIDGRASRAWHGPPGPTLAVVPRRGYADHADFDKALRAAGLKRFVRRSMPSDRPGSGTPLDPAGWPDWVAECDLGDWVMVAEIEEGVRVSCPVEIEGEGGATQ
jgi:hypothetical protein